jgi:flagellar hook-basal body complex protein FliE
MELRGIESLGDALNPASDKKQGSGFAEVLNQGIAALNQSQLQSRELGQRLAAGEDLELHDVMIAGQEAQIAMRLTMQLRNQALEAYREIMRMPV